MKIIIYISICSLIFLSCNSDEKKEVERDWPVVDSAETFETESSNKELDSLPIHGEINREVLDKYYPKVSDAFGKIKILNSRRIDSNPKNEIIVSLLRNTGASDEWMLCTHNKKFDLIDQQYIGKATMFDDGKSHTIDYSVNSNNEITFHHVDWGFVRLYDEKDIDTVKYELQNISIDNNGFIKSEMVESCYFPPLRVYLDDSDENKTNIRKEPNGEVIFKLDGNMDYYYFYVIDFEKGWFMLDEIQGVEGDKVKIPGNKGWIHHSVIGAGTRKNIKLLDHPKSGIVIGTIEQEVGIRIKEICSNWVKVEYNGVSGWVDSEWLCGNPVTTCP